MRKSIVGEFLVVGSLLFGLSPYAEGQQTREIPIIVNKGTSPPITTLQATQTPAVREVQSIKVLISVPPSAGSMRQAPTPSVTTSAAQPATTPPVVPASAVDARSARSFQPVIPTDTSPVARPQSIEVPEMPVQTGGSGYSMACASCQGVLVQDGNATLFPVKSTLFGVAHDGTVTIARGRLLAIATKSDVRLAAGTAHVLVRAGGSAAVETLADGSSRIFVLTGNSEHAPVVVSAGGSAASSIELAAGQMAAIGSRNLSDEELISVDGINTQPVQGGIAFHNQANIRIREYSIGQMFEKNLLIGCAPGNFSPANRSGRVLKQLHERLRAESGIVAAAGATVPGESLSTAHVRHSTVVAQPWASRGHTFLRLDPEKIVALSAGTRAESNVDNSLRIESGSALVKSRREFTIAAPGTDVKVARGGIVLVSVASGSVRVSCLHESHRDSVLVSHASRTAALSSGKEVIVSDAAPIYSDVYGIRQVGRRGIIAYAMNTGGWITWSDISIADMLAHHPILASLTSSADKSLNRRIVSPLMRTAAALNITGGHKGEYAQGSLDDEERELVVLHRI